MIKILANDGIHPDGVLLLQEAGYEVNTTKIPQDELPAKLPEYDVIIVRSATKVREALMDQCNLKIVARGGVGLDNIDVDHAKSKGIEVINTPAASSQSVAELVFGHIFTLARSLHLSNRQMPGQGVSEFKKLKKSYAKGVQLRGKTLGVVGLGRIGRETARIGLGLGMRVLPVDLYIDKAQVPLNLYDQAGMDINVTLETVAMDYMLENSDFISLHVPAVGKALISTEEFKKMKNAAIIVNASRGGVIDEAALLEALDAGEIAGAGLDVFVNEPTPNEALLNHDKISVTPHTGASTLEAQRNIGLELAEKIIAYLGDNK